MKTFKLTFIWTSVLLISCSQSEQSTDKSQAITQIENDKTPAYKPEIALQFINAYVENSNKMTDAVSITEWIQANEQASTTLKTELKRIVDEADPEMGLEADPLFDAQDYPEKGFELESFDEQTNFLIVKGKEQPDFKLSMKLVQENNKWLVVGCGIVNIPENKRIKR